MNIPALGGNWVDFVIIAFVLLTVWEAYRRGFIIGLFDFLGFVLSFGVALKYYTITSTLLVANFSFPKGIADAVGFFAVAFIAEIVFSYIFSHVVGVLPERLLTSRINTALGIVPPIAIALLTTTFILTLALSLPIRGSFKSAIMDSKIGGALVAQTQVFEQSLADIFGGAAFETLNFLTIAPDPGSKTLVDLNFTQNSHTIDEQAEKRMFTMVNQERADQGLPPLASSDTLRDLARSYGADMFENGYFSHYSSAGESPFDRMQAVAIPFITAGENLALAPAVLVAHSGLMASPGHRANILSEDYGHVGIGVIDGGIYGKMFVQEYTD